MNFNFARVSAIQCTLDFCLYFVYIHVGYAKAMDKDGRPLASSFYSGQVGFHDTLFVSTVHCIYSTVLNSLLYGHQRNREVFLFYRGHHEDITFKIPLTA